MRRGELLRLIKESGRKPVRRDTAYRPVQRSEKAFTVLVQDSRQASIWALSLWSPRIAQIAQRFGANDIDGTVVEERICHDAGATTSRGVRRGELLRLTKESGRKPVERDTAYRSVQRTEKAFAVLVQDSRLASILALSLWSRRIAQIAQRFGANDIDGTVVEERICHDAGATTSRGVRRGELLRLIKESGRKPVERDTAYRPVQRTEKAFTVLV